MNANDNTYWLNLKQWLEEFKAHQKKFCELFVQTNIFPLWREYQQNNQKEFEAFQTYLQTLETEAFDLLAAKLDILNKQGQQVERFDQICEIWLDCCEHLHAKMIATKNYQQLYGQFVNAFLMWVSINKKAKVKI